MKINIKYTNFKSTPAIDAYIENKIQSLSKYIKRMDAKGAPVMRVEVGRTTKHHNKGDVYRAEVNLKLPGKLLRSEHEDWDVRRAIDEVKQEIQRDIKRYKERTRPQDSRGQREARKARGKQ